MLISARNMKGLPINAKDGTLGKVSDFLVEDNSHHLRWVVADVGAWLSMNEVLLPPIFCSPDDSSSSMDCSLNKEQISSSPPAGSDQPVSRAYEELVLNHYQLIPYWGPTTSIPTIVQLAVNQLKHENNGDVAQIEDLHLRSVEEILGYRINATDDTLGPIVDMIFQADDWSLQYLIANTHNWLPGGKEIVLSPQWVTGIDYVNRQVDINRPTKSLAMAPTFDRQHLNADYATELEKCSQAGAR